MKLRWNWALRDPIEPVPAPPPAPPPLPEEDELLNVGPVELGERAATLLRDPLLRAAFKKVRVNIQSMWLASKADEAEQRERYHQMIVALDAVEAELKRYITQKAVVERRRDEWNASAA